MQERKDYCEYIETPCNEMLDCILLSIIYQLTVWINETLLKDCYYENHPKAPRKFLTLNLFGLFSRKQAFFSMRSLVLVSARNPIRDNWALWKSFLLLDVKLASKEDPIGDFDTFWMFQDSLNHLHHGELRQGEVQMVLAPLGQLLPEGFGPCA